MSEGPEKLLAEEAQKDLVRQGERTVDNLKRLFAVVFALSFTVVGSGAIEKVRPVLLLERAAPSPWLWFVNFEMITVFLVTAAVFYHQSVKFLDIRYARQPLSEAHPVGFAVDYLVLVLTATPFFLMAHALSPTVTYKVGYLWYFVSYISLLGFGLLLLLIAEIRHLRYLRVRLLRETIPIEEVRRENVLRAYWLLMNGTALLILVLGFSVARQFHPCPATSHDGAIPWFLVFFGVIALCRDYFDFRYAWPFLFPVSDLSAERLLKWPITNMKKARSLAPYVVAGLCLVAVAAVILACLAFWDVSYWVMACR